MLRRGYLARGIARATSFCPFSLHDPHDALATHLVACSIDGVSKSAFTLQSGHSSIRGVTANQEEEASMSTKTLGVIVTVTALSGTACSLLTTVGRNTDAINGSSATIGMNTQAVNATTAAMTSLKPALEGLQKLEPPMRDVAALSPTLRAVSELSGPMVRLAGLDTSMRAVAQLQTPMTRLVEIRPSLDATAALNGPMVRLAQMRSSLEAVASLHDSMDRVAGLKDQLAAVAALRGAMQELGNLRQPMEHVAALEPPMTRLAALGAMLDRPGLLLLGAAIGLSAWGVITFVAVRLAIVSAARAAAPRA
jgi:hypothetical protein